ncbi:phosphopantetheine-binding protein [Nocardia ninae]|uniref:Carrier domain-containing protein n=1 Tax=Nocardia ninae NBRC 108245 TaxID=1210091 RepID=A0A511MIP6_9NOCA|nr:phosphopantetheine-binding protein [Nocardia ninae]GEM39796.1 hypothetical protein NN4_43150 [Nocardia ninae NBRC 108245]
MSEDGAGTADPHDVAGHIAQSWCRALQVPEVHDDDDFFELGGHSLLVTRIVSYLRRELGVEVDMLQVFDTSSFGEFRDTVAELVAKTNGATR